MPNRREYRFFYPIDWPQLSAVIRFGRAKGRCEGCGRPHGQTVFHLGDGRWWDEEAASWCDGAGEIICLAIGTDDVLGIARTTRVVLATTHRNHDTADNSPANLAAFCQRCHMVHDRPEHQRRRWRTLFRRKALGDLFRGPYGRWKTTRAFLRIGRASRPPPARPCNAVARKHSRCTISNIIQNTVTET